MRQYGFRLIACVGLLIVCGTSGTASQDQQQTQPDTLVEYNAYQAAHNESDAQAKIKLLDELAAKYPDLPLLPSALLQQIYSDYYQAYFSTENYPKVIEYADKLVALGDTVDIDSRMLALVSREVSYSAGCSDPGLRTPEAYMKARDAGRQGLEILGQWQRPENVTFEQFDAEKKSFRIILNGVTDMAESGLEGHAVNCAAPMPVAAAAPRTPYDGRNFDRMINDIKDQERQSPRVR
jgi:hypothetical protein